MARRSWLIWPIFFILLTVVGWGLRSHSQSWYFQDETDHLTMGWLMWSSGRRLYTDLSLTHQPLPVLVGAVLTKLLPYNSLFLLIERVRWAMLLYLVASSAWLVGRFRWRGLMTSIVMLSLSHWFFGWYVLGESLAAPAVAVVMLYLLAAAENRSCLFTPLDVVILAEALLVSFFSLLPLWPFVALTTLWFLWRLPLAQKRLLVLAGLLPTLILFSFISPIAWWEETVLTSVRYVIPSTMPSNRLAMLFYPFIQAVTLAQPLGRLLAASVVLVALAVWQSRRRRSWLIGLSILWLLNTRVDHFNVFFYQGFHLWPYLAGLAGVLAAASTQVWRRWSTPVARGILILVWVGLSAGNLVWVAERKDRLTENAIQYGTYQAIANALNLVKNPGDALLTGPDGDGYLHILTGLSTPDRQVFHLNWAWHVPKLQADWRALLAAPPAFVYFQTEPSSFYYQSLAPLLAKQYHRLYRTDGRATDLYVRQDVVIGWNETQRQALVSQFFTLP